MKTLLLGLSLSALFATPAMAQQVVELPSLGAMIEQSTNGGTIQQAEEAVRQKPMKVPVKKERRTKEQATPQDQASDNQRDAEKAALRAQEIALKAQNARESDLVKQVKALQKQLAKQQKKYKPLKRVRFLPPNATDY